MQPRPLGATGLRVTPVGLGLAALGRPAYIDLGRDADLGPARDVEALERRCHQVLDELTRLRDQGVAIGLSASGPAQAATIRRALELTTAGKAPFACVQATWNLLEPSAGPALAEAGQGGWGVVVKEAVANGRLTPHGRDPATQALARIAATHDVGIDAVALAAVLANPWAGVVLSGAVTPAQLESNLAAPQVELHAAELEELAALAEPPDQYWRHRATLSWS